jgi:ketosteroid isomerase-like protein
LTGLQKKRISPEIPEPEYNAMTLQAAAAVIRASNAIFEAMNVKNMAVLEPYLAEDAVFDFPGTSQVVGKKRVLIFLKALLRKFPDLFFQVQDVIVDSDKACIVWTNSARLATPSPYRNSGVTLVHCANGLIICISDYFKDTSFMNTTVF